ncbi:MAG: hypothetical protein KatS3mg016_0318 [Fimbriimonadales bacterium]|nr:MAG: hypothetical protein KatS3mg016_0318 [Fimbriimonadales bacterium]
MAFLRYQARMMWQLLFWAGLSLGAVVLQGAFLLLFDTWHAVRLPRTVHLAQE